MGSSYRKTPWHVDFSWNVMAHGDAREGKWRGNWRMEWVASTLHTTSEHGASSITTADAHTSAAQQSTELTPHADLNGLVRFAERRNLVSARVLSRFGWPIPLGFLSAALDCFRFHSVVWRENRDIISTSAFSVLSVDGAYCVSAQVADSDDWLR